MVTGPKGVNWIAAVGGTAMIVFGASAAATGRVQLDDAMAEADLIVRGSWESTAGGDHVQLAEVLDGHTASNRLHCLQGTAQRPAPNSILLLRMRPTESCQLISSVSPVQSGLIMYRIGQKRFARGDHAGAAAAWRSALDGGPLDGYNNLGYLLSEGLGVPRDDKEAVRLWTYAALRGVAEAQLHLAQAYFSGRGATKNLAEALARAFCAEQLAQRESNSQVVQAVSSSARSLTQRINRLASAREKANGKRRAEQIMEQLGDYWTGRLQ